MRKAKIIVMLAALLSALPLGVYADAVMTMYAPDGRTEIVSMADAEAWQNVGWYTAPVTTMYAPDGRTAVVAASDTAAWQNVGWYAVPVTTMYAPDGKTAVVAISDTAAWQNVGWYTVPVTTMYAPDGRTAVVAQSEVSAWKNVGWYESYSQAQSANVVSSAASGTKSTYGGGYYRTPYGEKYHLNPTCGGKNSYRTTNISGLSPCAKCAK